MAPLYLCHHALRLGLLTLKNKVLAYLAFVSWHNLSLTFIIWSSGIPHFGAIRVNEKIKPLSIPMRPFSQALVAVPFNTTYCHQMCMAGNCFPYKLRIKVQ